MARASHRLSVDPRKRHLGVASAPRAAPGRTRSARHSLVIGKNAARRSDEPARAGAAAVPAVGAIQPQLATLVDRAPVGPDYVYEVKYDGYRALATIAAGTARIATRSGQDWTGRFPYIHEALERLPLKNSVLDGEICYVLDDGRTDFQHLQNALKQRNPSGRHDQHARVVYFVFDLLFHEGEDLRGLPLRERKKRLHDALPRRGTVRYGEHLTGDGPVVLTQACELGLEGIVAKRNDRPYRSGRGTDWVKVKCNKRQEFVIVGMTRPKGARSGFGALLVAYHEKGELRFAGKVGTGFTQRSLDELSARLEKLTVREAPLARAPRLKDVTWVEPRLVCEIAFTEFTRDGSLRHPSFQGLREDKPAAQVGKERALHLTKAGTAVPPRAAAPLRIEGVKISNPDRVMDPASGTTKAGLVRYHAAVSQWLMPHARKRPLALVRCPEGNAHQCFFQKHAMRGLSPAIERHEAGGDDVIAVSRAKGIIELVQFNVMEFHGWGSHLPSIQRPDWVVFDLDPDEGLDFRRVVDAALEIREQLAAVGLRSFVKTTGGKGLHVVVPLRARAEWPAVKAFARAVAQAFAAQAPDRYVASATKHLRKGRIFVDYLRNDRGSTAVLPYSPRARRGATVAMPVPWKDLAHLDPREFSVSTVPRLIERRRADPWADFFDLRQTLPARLLRSLEADSRGA